MLSVFEMHSVATLLALSTKEKRKLIVLRKMSGRGFPFVFREKPFGRAYNWANFANVKREQRPKGYPQRGGHKLPHKDKERDTEDQNRAGLQKIRIEL